jgi:hypothetical protein
MKRKGIIGIGTAIVIAVIAMVSVLLIPQTRSAILSVITPTTCTLSPFDENCGCPEGLSKKEVNGVPFAKYICEGESVVINPDSQSFEEDAIAYAKGRLTEIYPDCNSVSCTNGEASASWTIDFSGNRMILAECRGDYQILWDIYIDLDTSSVERVSCIDYTGIPDNPEMTPEEFKARCEGSIDNQYCNTIFSASESDCSTHEIFPPWSCSTGRQCTKGVGYAYELVDSSWIGCGDWAAKEWAKGG